MVGNRSDPQCDWRINGSYDDCVAGMCHWVYKVQSDRVHNRGLWYRLCPAGERQLHWLVQVLMFTMYYADIISITYIHRFDEDKTTISGVCKLLIKDFT